MAGQPETKRGKLLRRKTSLWNERSSWFTHWREISDYLMPRQGRFFVSDRNQGKKRHNNIYDSTGGKALDRLSAGLMAGMTSPARPWFRLAVADDGLMEVEAVKAWLDDTTKIMRDIFSRSNTYRALHSLYKELGGFGTGANIVLPNFDAVIHQHQVTVGEYAISTDHLGYVDTMVREFDMTISQVVKNFGLENCSRKVQEAYNEGNLDHWVTVVHVIEPREDRDPKKRDNKNMPFMSCYFEMAGEGDDKMLREGGFMSFPGLVPRWDVSGGDIYGNSPGMAALGDIRQLQHQHLRKAEGIDYMVKPPVQIPVSMMGKEHDLLPGGTSYYDAASSSGGIKSAFDVNLRLDHLLMDIQDARMRIKEAFYEDLFMMIANDQRSNITAREIAERHEEKLIMLGPVLERLHNELLSPLIDLTFERMVEVRIVPPPPREMQGMDLNVEFVSMLAQAQRAVGIGAVDRLIGTVGAVAQAKGSADPWDKVDTDQMIDKYSDMLGVDPDLILADDKVAIIRNQRAKQQQQMQQAAMMQPAADAAKTLSETDTEGESALTAITRQFTQL